MTLNVYASPFENDLDVVSDRFDAAVSAAAAASVRPEVPAAVVTWPSVSSEMRADQGNDGRPSRIRTCDTGFRNAAVRDLIAPSGVRTLPANLWPPRPPLVDMVSRHD